MAVEDSPELMRLSDLLTEADQLISRGEVALAEPLFDQVEKRFRELTAHNLETTPNDPLEPGLLNMVGFYMLKAMAYEGLGWPGTEHITIDTRLEEQAADYLRKVASFSKKGIEAYAVLEEHERKIVGETEDPLNRTEDIHGILSAIYHSWARSTVILAIDAKNRGNLRFEEAAECQPQDEAAHPLIKQGLKIWDESIYWLSELISAQNSASGNGVELEPVFGQLAIGLSRPMQITASIWAAIVGEPDIPSKYELTFRAFEGKN